MVPLNLIPLYTGGARDNGYFAPFVVLFSLPLFWGGVVYAFGGVIEGFMRRQHSPVKSQDPQ
jgi:hypothetical protein